MSQYSITVPDNPVALRAAAEFFTTVAEDAGKNLQFEELADVPRQPLNFIVHPGGGTPSGPYQIDKDHPDGRRFTFVPEVGPSTPTVSVQLVPQDQPTPTQSAPVTDASAPGAEQTTPAPSAVPPAPPAPGIPAPPADSTGAAMVPAPPDAASVFGASSPETSTPGPVPVDLDSRGLPWDGRIHASTKARIADGSWRNRKRPQEYDEPAWTAFITQVEGELKAAIGAPPATGTPPAPPAATGTPAPPAATGPIKTIQELVTYITSHAIPTERVNDAVKSAGLQAFPLLGARPDLIPVVAAALIGGAA